MLLLLARTTGANRFSCRTAALLEQTQLLLPLLLSR
jgi:hypothetical protein